MLTPLKNENMPLGLKEEIMLQVNQRLWRSGVISKEVYELARIRIVGNT